MTSEEFKRQVDEAKEAALEHPMFIVDDDYPSHVLLSFGEYRRLASGGGGSLAYLLCWPVGVGDFELELPPRDEWIRPFEFD